MKRIRVVGDSVFVAIDENTNISSLTRKNRIRDKNINYICIYTYEHYPNYQFLDSIADKVFLIALVDLFIFTDLDRIVDYFISPTIDITTSSPPARTNTILDDYVAPSRDSFGKVTREQLTEWYSSLEEDSKFDIWNFGNFLGKDLDLLVTKKKGVKSSIRDLNKFMRKLKSSANFKIDSIYCNSDYFHRFYNKDNRIIDENVMIGIVSKDYKSLARKFVKDNMVFFHDAYKWLFFKTVWRAEQVGIITKFSELPGYKEGMHISPHIYNAIFNGYGKIKKFTCS